MNEYKPETSDKKHPAENRTPLLTTFFLLLFLRLYCIIDRASEILLFNCLNDTSTTGRCCCSVPPAAAPPRPLFRSLNMAIVLSSAFLCGCSFLLRRLLAHAADEIARLPLSLADAECWKCGLVCGSFASKPLRAGTSTMGATVGRP